MSVMTKIRLETDDGRYVANAEMPPFQEWPEVVIWGQRVFQLQTKGKEGELTVYREVFAMAVLATVSNVG